MIYDKYKAKIEYLAKVWGAIKRFKFLIMSAILAVTAIISGLVAAKGAISWKTEPLSEITYGESLSMDANAFLSDVSYEYKTEDGVVWKSETPTAAGNYSVRAVADAAFGKKRYTDAKAFTILPVSLVATINENSIVYGEMPTLSCEGLVGEDKISCVGVTYGGLNTETESIVSVTPQIVNANGVDVTGCYTLAFDATAIDITPRSITIDTPSATKVYDGTPLSATEYTVSAESGLGLYSDDRITSSILTELTNAGELANTMTLTVENADGVDVSAYYNPTYNAGTLTVTKRPITVESQGYTWTYDGDEHVHNAYFSPETGEESGIVQGQAIQFNFTGAITNAGTVENTFTVEIYDGNEPVTGNYDITPVYGVLTVDKLPITITSESYSGWTYNAEFRQHTEYSITSGALVDGQEETVSFTGRVKNATTVENTFTVEIYDGNEPVTDNYEITPVYGTLTVNKADITLRTNDDSKPYDGTPLFNQDYTFENGELFGGQTLTFTDKTEATFVKDTGDNVLTTFEIKQNGNAYDGEFLLNDNYNVTVNYGTLTITKRAVTVTAASDSKSYDGTPFSKTEFTTANLPENHTLTATVATQNAQKHVGEYANVASGASVTHATYGDVTGQFTFTYDNGTLTITKRQVKLTLTGVEKVYDATAQVVEKGDLKPVWDTAYKQPVDEVEYTIDCTALTNVSTGNYTVFVTFNDGNGGENYQEIDGPATASFAVIPRLIRVKLHSHTWTYDGNEHGCINAGCTYTSADLDIVDGKYYGLAVETHNVIVVDSKKLTDVGSEQNVAVLTVDDGNDGNNYEVCYTVDENGGTLTITARKITIHTHSHAFEYNAQAQNCNACGDDGYEIEDATDTTGLVPLQEITVTFTKSVVNVGDEESNEFSIYVTDNGTDVTGNYELSENCSLGTLTVTPREIKVKPHTFTVTYNGEKQGCKLNNCPYNESDLIDGTTLASRTHTLELVSATAERNVGTYDNIIEVRVNDGNDGKNYVVSYGYGTITIEKLKVSLRLDDIRKIYDGTEQTVTLDDVKNNSEWSNEGEYSLPVDEAIFTLNCPVLTNVETDDFTLYITFNDGNDGGNYDIEKNSLTAQFIVQPRPIILQTHSHTWTYDGEEHSCLTHGCKFAYNNADLSENSQYDLLQNLGHTLEITYAASVTNVWETESGNNLVRFKVNDGNDGANYDVSCEHGTLTITPRPVIVHTHDHEFIYNGKPQNCYDHGCGESAYTVEPPTENTGLVSGHRMELFLQDSVVNVGNTQENCGYAYCYNGTDNVTQNYNFSDDSTWGTLSVAPREIIIHTHDHEFIYNGKAQNCQSCGDLAYEPEEPTQDTGLVDGQDLTVIFSNSVTNVGDEKRNEFTILIEYDGLDVTYNYRLSDACTFGDLTVAKRAVYFILDTVYKTYNGEMQYPQEGDISYTLSTDTIYHTLVPEHRVRFFDITCDGAKNVGTVGFSFRLVIASGNDDVTANYDIQPENLTGTLEITRRPITVTIDDVARIYNGKYQTPSAEDLIIRSDNIVERHEISIIEASLPKMRDAGCQEFEITVVIYEGPNINDAEVTDNYLINDGEPVIVKFTIEKRQIVIQSHDHTWTYDGRSHDCNGETDAYTLVVATDDTGLVAEHELSLTFTGSITDVVDGGVPNTFTFVILDKNGEPVTDNYELLEDENTYGKLTITPRTVRVATTHTHEFTYNGQWQSCKTCKQPYSVTVDEENGYYALVGEHKLTVLTATEVMNVADCGETGKANALTFSVDDGNDGKNYTVVTEGIVNGVLTMKKAVVTVERTCDHEWTYDGKAHSCKLDDCTVLTVVGLGYGHALYVKTATTVTDITDEYGVDNVVEYGVQSANGNDISDNYEIFVQEYGKLQIYPCELTIRASSRNELYVGRYPFADYIHEWEYVSTPLSANYEVLVTGAVDEEIVNAGESTKHSIVSVVVLHNGEDVTDNFVIDYLETGTFTIKKRYVTVTAISEEHVYTGETFIIDENSYEYSNVIEGHTLTVETTGAYGTDVGRYENTVISSAVIVDENGIPVTDNYEISYHDGALRITNCAVTIITGSASKPYDGTPLTCEEYEIVVDNATGELAFGHKFVVLKFTGSQTEVGVAINGVAYAIVDADGNDVSMQYSTIPQFGDLEVTPRDLIISTGSAEKPYDGTALTNDAWSWSALANGNGGLVDGHEIKIACTGSQTDAGTSSNTFTYSIIDTLNNDKEVTWNYTVEQDVGTLRVLPRYLTFTTGSAEKPYDGTPLTNSEYTYVSGLMHEHTLDKNETYTTGSQTEVGRSKNTLRFVVLNADDMDISHNYEFAEDCSFGWLVVTDSKPQILFYVTTDRDGDVYLRQLSYGDYDASTGVWGTANPYEYGEDNVSPLYYAGLALQNYGVSASSVTVERAEEYAGWLPYMMPYYVTDSDGTAYGDVYADYAWSDSYTLDYYAYVGRSALIPAEYAQAEEAYAEYVHNNYVALPQTTKAYMRTIINEQGWSADDENIIDVVATYIRNAATYNLRYDVDLDSAGDVAVAFLRDYREGVCRHYASAATAMFRELGIPARYTEGFYASTLQGEKTPVSIGHAWVEVYIDGMGWVNVEVTGSGIYKQELTIKPEDFVGLYPNVTEYDAALERASNEGIVDAKGNTLETLLSFGYWYEASVSGSLVGIGEAEIEIVSFTLYNSDYEVVTDDFEIIFEKGSIVIKEKIITLSGGAWKYYDGTALDYGTQNWMATVKVNGETYANGEFVTVSLHLDWLPALINATRLDDETLRSCVTVEENGVDVTDEYYIDTMGLVYEVRKMGLSIKIGNASKPYDGTVLNSTAYSLRNGSLVANHTLTIETTGSGSSEVGTYKNELLDFTVKDLSGNDVTDNYEILDWTWGTLTITD